MPKQLLFIDKYRQVLFRQKYCLHTKSSDSLFWEQKKKPTYDVCERVFIVIDLMWPIKTLNHILNGLLSKLTWRNTLDWPKKELRNDGTADSLPFTLLESLVKIWLWPSKYLADRLFQFSIVWILFMVKFTAPPPSKYFACFYCSPFQFYSHVHFQYFRWFIIFSMIIFFQI